MNYNVNQADRQYKRLIEEILVNGVSDEEYNVRTKWDDGTPAHTLSVHSKIMRFDNTEVPILTSKKVAWKTAIKELLWIWQMKSNSVQDLRDMGVTIWDEWKLEDGTIGNAYGYQLGKKNRRIDVNKLDGNEPRGKKHIGYGNEVYYMVDQVDYLLHQLVNNPASRRHITTLWNPDDLDKMALTPCVYETQWFVKNGKLSLDVRCRSNDLALGNPFNIFQYNVLQRMIAQITGYELGEYTYYIGDAHLYTRHIEPLKEQIQGEVFAPPTLWINPDVKSFYDFTIDDFKLIDYKHGKAIPMEVAI